MSKNNPLVSIITVVRNAPEDLEKTVQSILCQTYSQVEFIIIDGGSTDGTVDVIKNLSEQVTFWISEPDRGIYDAMNKGLAKATGEWVNFMNAGDAFAGEDVISKVMARNLEGVGVVYGDSVAAYPASQVLKRAGTPEEMVKGMVFSHQAVFVRREIVIDKGFDLTYPVAADFEMMFRLYSAGCTFKYLPFPVAVVDVSGVSNRKMVQSAREHLAIAMKYRKLNIYEQAYHCAYICWVALVTAGYKILPASLVQRISNFFSKLNNVNKLSPPSPPLPGERGPGGEVRKPEDEVIKPEVRS